MSFIGEKQRYSGLFLLLHADQLEMGKGRDLMIVYGRSGLFARRLAKCNGSLRQSWESRYV